MVPAYFNVFLFSLFSVPANVLKNSTVPKYRAIKKSNSKLQASLYCLPSALACLIALGFEEKQNVQQEGEPGEEPGFEFPPVTAQVLRELHRKHRLILSVLQSKFCIQVAGSAPPTPSTPGVSACVYWVETNNHGDDEFEQFWM